MPLKASPGPGSLAGKVNGIDRRWFIRAVPVMLLALGVIVMSLAIAVAVNAGITARDGAVVHIGPIELELVFAAPSLRMVGAGVLVAGGVAVLVHGANAMASRQSTHRARDRADALDRPLRAESVTSHERGRLSVTALIPARNEAMNIEATIRSLQHQTTPPAAIWVIADNCTDDTAAIAARCGARVFETVDNVHRKAGGLNQVLTRLLPRLGWNDLVLVMDADTLMAGDFLERAIDELVREPELAAIGGVFYGDSAPGLLAQLQRNEFLRYSREISRQDARVFVLTGTASLFRAEALATVARSRGTLLPGVEGDVYDTYSLTEDNELTMALRQLGAGMIAPKDCQVRTQLMPTWKDLWHQRERWQRGAIENIGMYGVTRASATNWLQQLGLGYGVIAFSAYVALSVLSVVAVGLTTVVLFWVVVGALFLLERLATVWRGGWRARLLALPIVIELGYAAFLQAVYVKSLFDVLTGASKSWNAAAVERPTT